MRKFQDLREKFRASTKGSVSILFGVMSISLMLLMGLAIDTARFYDLSNRVQASLDAASLAGAKLLIDETLTDADIKARAQAYFDSKVLLS